LFAIDQNTINYNKRIQSVDEETAADIFNTKKKEYIWLSRLNVDGKAMFRNAFYAFYLSRKS